MCSLAGWLHHQHYIVTIHAVTIHAVTIHEVTIHAVTIHAVTNLYTFFLFFISL